MFQTVSGLKSNLNELCRIRKKLYWLWIGSLRYLENAERNETAGKIFQIWKKNNNPPWQIHACRPGHGLTWGWDIHRWCRALNRTTNVKPTPICCDKEKATLNLHFILHVAVTWTGCGRKRRDQLQFCWSHKIIRTDVRQNICSLTFWF